MSKILIDEATVKLVLAALEPRPGMPNPEYESLTQCAITALKALAEQPPQRTWVGLTDEEAQWLYDNCRTPSNLINMTEAKLKQKNI